jgi:hypothetical protein
MNVRTTHSTQMWQSPDGKRTIWEVTLESSDGNDYKLKTYSPQIAEVGWSGEVRSYLNPRGDRFVRALSGPARSEPSGRDDLSIRAQWAIGQAINLASVKMEKDAITMPVIEKYAKELFETVSRVKGEQLSDEDKRAGDDMIEGLTRHLR